MTTIQLRRGTAAAWTAAETTLAVGEPGYETDTGRFKIGDGLNPWGTLPYESDPGGSAAAALAAAEAFATAAVAAETTRAEAAEANKASTSALATEVSRAEAAEGLLLSKTSVLITSLPKTVLDPTYGGKGDGLYLFDGVISGGSLSQLVSASADFVPGDVGKLILIMGAGAGGASLSTTIAAYVSATTVNLTNAATTAVSGAQVCYGTDDTAAFNAAAGAPKADIRLTPGAIHCLQSMNGVSEMRMAGAAGARMQQISLASQPRPLIWFPTGNPGSIYRPRLVDLELFGEGINPAKQFQQAAIFSGGGSQDVRIERCHAEGFWWGGLVLFNGYQWWADDNTLVNCGAGNELNALMMSLQFNAAGSPATYVSGAQTLPVTTLAVNSTAGFATSGTLWVGGQLVTYTGISGNTFTGCTGGVGAMPTLAAVYPSSTVFPSLGEWHVRGNTIDGFNAGGICAQSYVGFDDLEVEITGNTVKNGPNWIGIVAEAGWVKKGVIAGNVIDACLQGVGVENTFNTSEDATSMGDWTISDNIITLEQVASSVGVQTNGAHTVIEGNQIGAQTNCILVNEQRGAVPSTIEIVGNDLLFNSAAVRASDAAAVSIANAIDAAVKDNTITFEGGGVTIGILMGGCINPNVDGNTIDGAGWHPIWYSGCTNINHGLNYLRNPNQSLQSDGSGVYLDGSVVDTRHNIDGRGIIDNYAVDPPTSLAVSQSGSGSTLSGAQSYRVAATTAQGSTLACAPVQITITGAQNAVLTWVAPVGQGTVTGYTIYGRTAGSEALLATVSGTTLTYTDTGAATPSGAVPSWNASGKMKYGVNSQLAAGSKVRLLTRDIIGAAVADLLDAHQSFTDYAAFPLQGQAGVYAPNVNPWAAQGALSIAAGRLYVNRGFTPIRRSFTEVVFVVNTADASNDGVIVCVFNSSGVLLSKSSLTTGKLNATAEQGVSLINPVHFAAGDVFYVGVLAPTLTGSPKLQAMVDASGIGAMINSSLPGVEGFQQSSLTDAPAVLTPAFSGGNPMLALL